MTELELAKYLEDYKKTGQVFVHATKEVSVLENIFMEGIKKQDRLSIMSTIMLLNENKDLLDEILRYYYRDYKVKVIVTIPKEFENLFIGEVDTRNVDINIGLQYGSHSILDEMELDVVPKEFVLGAVVQFDKTFKFVQNPNYYATNENAKQNVIKMFKKGDLLVRLYSGIDAYSEEYFELLMQSSAAYGVDWPEFMTERFKKLKENSITKS